MKGREGLCIVFFIVGLIIITFSCATINNMPKPNLGGPQTVAIGGIIIVIFLNFVYNAITGSSEDESGGLWQWILDWADEGKQQQTNTEFRGESQSKTPSGHNGTVWYDNKGAHAEKGNVRVFITKGASKGTFVIYREDARGNVGSYVGSGSSDDVKYILKNLFRS